MHHGLSSTLKAFFLKYTQANFAENKPADFVRELNFDPPKESFISESKPSYETHISYKNYGFNTQKTGGDFRSRFLGGSSQSSGKMPSTTAISSSSLAEQALSAAKGSDASEEALNFRAPAPSSSKIKFIGSCLGTFLLVEKDNTLYFIDQHAVHERILFDKLMNNQGKSQPLLIPYKIKTDSKTQDNQLEKLKDALTSIGFTTKKISDGEWEITSIPERWTGTEYDLRTMIFVKHVEPKEIIRSIAAMTACKAAVKDGYVLDDQTAAELAEKAFTLKDPHCPHGRPVYTTITREQLFALVKRT